MDRTLFQTLEPSHCYGTKTRGEHLAQKIVPRIKYYLLSEMTYMLHRVYLAVIISEWRMSKVSQHLNTLHFLNKR